MRGDRSWPEQKQYQESIPAVMDPTSILPDRSGKCLTEKQDNWTWTDNCSKLYNHENYGVSAIMDCSQPPEDLHPILRVEVENAEASVKRESLPKLIMYQQKLFKLEGRP